MLKTNRSVLMGHSLETRILKILKILPISQIVLFLWLPANCFATDFRSHPFLEFDIEGRLSAHSELVDIDRDGDLDIVVANGRHWPQANMIYLNDGRGRMIESFRLGAKNKASYIVRSGDLDGDGDSDLVVIGDNLPIEVYTNNDGSFDEPKYLLKSRSYARGAVLTDLNGDKKVDLVVVPRRGKSRLYFGNGIGSFSDSNELPIPVVGATGVVAGDIDYDGDVDLVAALRDDQSSVLLINDGKGSFVSKPLLGSEGDHRQALIGEFTNDDYQDIILGDLNGNIKLIVGTPNGSFKQPIIINDKALFARSLASGDLDDDGDLDVVVGGDEQTNFALYNLGNGKFRVVELTTEANDTYGVSLGDLNNDGLLDIVFSNSESSNVILLNRKNK